MKHQLRNEYIHAEFDTIGGTLTSLKLGGAEYLWQGDERYWKGQSPVMFPICGSLREEKAVIGKNKRCNMIRHGFARFEEFIKSEQSQESISFSLYSNTATLEKYPYPFVLTITYRLDKKKLTVNYRIENPGEEPMPFFVGGHPGFNWPLDPKDKPSEYVIEFEYPETVHCPLPAEDPLLLDMTKRREILHSERILTLDHSLFQQDALVFDTLKSRKVRYYNPVGKSGVEVEFQDFPFLVLWSTKNGGPFVAIEPWLGVSTCTEEDDTFEHKRNVQIAAPGEKRNYQFSINLL